LVSYDWRDRDARDLVAASAEMLVLGVDVEALVALASKAAAQFSNFRSMMISPSGSTSPVGTNPSHA
jgi:hypothetical protein